MSVVITTYTLAGGFIEAGMNWWQAMMTILLGNTIVLIPMILNAHAGTKYGVSFPVLARASFGTKGANIPALLRAVVACGWFGIQTWIGGTALDALFSVMSPTYAHLFNDASVLGVALHTWIAFFLFWGIQVVIILKGVEGIKYLETWSAPLLLVGGLVLLIWAAWRAGGLGRVLTESAALQKQRNAFWTIFPGLPDSICRLLGHPELKHSGLHPLCAVAKIPDARPGAGFAVYDDSVRFHRRRCHQRNPADLRCRDPKSRRT